MSARDLIEYAAQDLPLPRRFAQFKSLPVILQCPVIVAAKVIKISDVQVSACATGTGSIGVAASKRPGESKHA
jgi:hypothetical protein